MFWGQQGGEELNRHAISQIVWKKCPPHPSRPQVDSEGGNEGKKELELLREGRRQDGKD